MAKRLSTLIAVAAASILLGAVAADAQTTRRAARAPKAGKGTVVAEISDATYRRPLTIQKRSFLDPGNAVPVGSSTPEYIAANTTEYRQVYTNYNTAFFGESELPGRFDLPPTNPRLNPSSEPLVELPFQ